jgi:hypothetical protein
VLSHGELRRVLQLLHYPVDQNFFQQLTQTIQHAYRPVCIQIGRGLIRFWNRHHPCHLSPSWERHVSECVIQYSPYLVGSARASDFNDFRRYAGRARRFLAFNLGRFPFHLLRCYFEGIVVRLQESPDITVYLFSNFHFSFLARAMGVTSFLFSLLDIKSGFSRIHGNFSKCCPL